MTIFLVCQATLTSPGKTENCEYNTKRADGLIDDQVLYVCECLSGHARAGGSGSITDSVCEAGTWSNDPLEDCVPGLSN